MEKKFTETFVSIEFGFRHNKKRIKKQVRVPVGYDSTWIRERAKEFQRASCMTYEDRFALLRTLACDARSAIKKYKQTKREFNRSELCAQNRTRLFNDLQSDSSGKPLIPEQQSPCDFRQSGPKLRKQDSLTDFIAFEPEFNCFGLMPIVSNSKKSRIKRFKAAQGVPEFRETCDKLVGSRL